MNIQYYGHSCFKITTKPGGRATDDVVIFFDPFDKETGLRPPQGQADVVLVSHDHHDHNNVSALKGDPVVINAAGEYSVKGVNLVGLEALHDENEGRDRGKVNIFILETEGFKICHLSDLGTDLTPKQLEEIDGVDILMIPVGGTYTVDGKKASEIARKIEPAMIIPMHYKLAGFKIDLTDEKPFCDAIGTCPKARVSKLTLKKKDLEGKNLEVVLMDTES
ncbi:MAG: Zn-dependent hydrolase of the beta-lactamase fold-like protein [Candidatus Moranbacteria bacterium GW2011_GWE2_47_10]|nr:MAG: Zn-dependent hydrolase of the beta-lactamase fold-like protein [Candidatus Moranbacteria bacterium GW2011_GWE2_47_10]